MDEQILEIINKLKGSLLGIGLTNENILNAIEENSNIDICYLLNNISLTKRKLSITKRGKNKKINIKKIKKQFKKKSLDNIICNFDIIKQFYRSFVPNSIYLCNQTIYIYGKKEDLEKLKQKYLRYTKEVKIENDSILIINACGTKNHFLKDLVYKIKDFGIDFVDLVTDILVN